MIEADPFRAASWVSKHLRVTTSLSTKAGPVSYVQLSEGGFKVVYPLDKSLPGLQSCPTRIWLVNYVHLHCIYITFTRPETRRRPTLARSQGEVTTTAQQLDCTRLFEQIEH